MIGLVALRISMTVLSVLCVYFGGMTLLLTASPVVTDPIYYLATACHLAAAVLSFSSLLGLILCYRQVIVRKAVFKWLPMAISIPGLTLLPVAIYAKVDDSGIVLLLCILAVLSAILLISIPSAFRYMESQSAKTP
jgi:hypothetical protein